jgi:hypothetical protein
MKFKDLPAQQQQKYLSLAHRIVEKYPAPDFSVQYHTNEGIERIAESLYRKAQETQKDQKV